MHIARSNNKYHNMKRFIANFPLCGDCFRKETRNGLKDDEYYCSIAEAILPTGIVTTDLDATNCVCNRWYKPNLK